MTSRFWAVLLAALATVTPVVAQSTFATLGQQSREDVLPQPKADAEAPAAKLPNSPFSPATPETPDKAPTGGSIVPAYLQPSWLAMHAWAPGGDPTWHENSWVSADYLLGFFRPVGTPPLVTSSPAGTPQIKAGVLGQPGTKVLFGNQAVEGESHSGFNLALGTWLTADKTLGAEVGFSYLPGQTSGFLATSDGSTILARPFINANNNTQNSLLVAFPLGSGPTGVKAAGSIAVSSSSGPFYGAYLDFRESVIRDPGFRLTTLLGYRFINFNDALQIQQTTLPSSTGSPKIEPGAQITAQDSFNAGNMFNGCDIGFEAELLRRNWSLTWVAKVAAGELQRGVDITGSTQSTPPANSPALPGGLLALSSNSGNHVSTIFSAVPETGIKASWIINDHVRLNVGYSVLVLMNSARAADQVDLFVNPKLINSSLGPPASPGAVARPAFSLNPTNMWVQMLDAGLEFRY